MEIAARDRLEVFVHRARELRDRGLARTALAQLNFTISWDSASQLLRYATPRIDEEDLRSFLLAFRHFISKGEPAYIERILNDCMRMLRSDHYRRELGKSRDEWKSSFQRMGPIAVTINERKLTGEYLLDLWINGVYFHNDGHKAAELHRLIGASFPLVKTKFLETLATLTQVIYYVTSVVEFGVREGLFQFQPD